jgi:nicotinamidase-related amidase
MGGQPRGQGKCLPCVLIDVNTQHDFLDEAGAWPALNREGLVPALRRVVAWSKWNHVPVVSSVECHWRDEVRAARGPQHCLDGTHGQEKLPFTVFASYVKVEGDNTLAVPIDLFRKHQQVIFRKRTLDFFLNPKADRFLTQLPASEFVMAGLGLESSIKAIALGLIARGKTVSIVLDACGYFERTEGELTARLLEAKGARILTVDELVARRLPRPIRYPVNACGQMALGNGLYASITLSHHPEPHVNGNGNGTGKNGHDGHRPLPIPRAPLGRNGVTDVTRAFPPPPQRNRASRPAP